MNEGDLVAGRYRLLHPIGAGGMGTVWAARHELLGRSFAIKLATLPERAGPEVRARFLREARIVGQLRHPNVVDVADVGDTGGGLYLAMELLEGQSLADRIATHGAFGVGEALAILSEICRGLEAAHAAGVVHRDIKPENIFLARGASGGVIPKLLDFGVSKSGKEGETIATLTGQLYGTPAYMSPEQALGENDVDHRSDIWSLGVVLYEMLTGERPFRADCYPALLPLIAEGEYAPLPETVPPEVQAIVGCCLEKSKDARYPSAKDLCRALDAARGVVNDPGARLVERIRVLPSLLPRRPTAADAPLWRTLAIGGLAFAVAASAAIYRMHRAEQVAEGTAAQVSSASEPAPSASMAIRAPAPSVAPTASSASVAIRAPLASSAAVAPRQATSTAKPAHPSTGAKPVTRVNSAGF